MNYSEAFELYGSVRKAAQAMDIPKSTFFDRLSQEKMSEDALNIAHPITHKVKKRGVRRYIFTCAVRGAPVHTDFLNNLKAYAKHIGADLIIGPLTSVGRQRYAELDAEDFDESIRDYISTTPISIGDKIRYSPELNLTATMVRPLAGLRTYSKRLWAIFPHTKVSVDTVPTHKGKPAKFLFTTGAVSHPYYTPTKAGYRAYFDHVHGALVVEVSDKGVWPRHVTPTDDDDGTFYDLNYKVSGGKISENKDGVRGIIYGDIHAEKLDPDVAVATWGYGIDYKSLKKAKKQATTLAGILKPEYQVFHDLIDFTAGNYHELDNLFRRWKNYVGMRANVNSDFVEAMMFLHHASEFASSNVVVDSNHDAFIEKWLLKFDPVGKEDFDNIETYYKLKLAVLNAIAEEKNYSLLEVSIHAMWDDWANDDGVAFNIGNVTFLKADESFEIDNIECGWHGHQGPNGRRGSKSAFAQVTEKATIGHLHSPSVDSGLYIVGTSSCLELGYNTGPSSWAHTHCIVYPHGGRTLITLSDARYWADQK